MNEELERMFSSENEKTLWHLTDLGVKDGMFGKYTLPKKAKGKAKFSDYAKSATNHNVSEEYLKLGKNAYILDDFGSQYLFTKNKYGINTIDRCYSPTPLFCFGRRPVIQLSDDIIEELKSSSNNLKTIKIGSYPQEKVKGKLEQQLNEKLKSGSLTKSDYLFKQDEYYYDENDKCYYHKKNAENNKTTKDLSSCYDYNGERYFENNQSWFKVSPVEWIVDSENKRLISKEVIDNYSNRNIETSDIAQVIFQDITRKYSKYYDRLNDNKKNDQVMSEEVLKSRSDEFLSKNKEAIVKLFSEENKGKLWDITIPEFSFVGNNEKDGPKSVIKEEKTSFPQPSDCCKSITVAGEERHCKFSLAGCNNPTNGDLYFGFYVISNLDGRKDLCAGSYGQDGEIIILPIMDNYRSTISVRPAIKLTDEAMKMLNLNNENINSIQLGSYPQKEEFYTISSSYDDPHKQDNYYNGNSDEERAPVEWHIDYEHKELVADRGLAACDAKCFDSDDYEGSDLKKFVDNMSCQMFKNLEKEIPDNYSIKKEEPAPTKEKALQDLSAALNQLQKDTMTDYGDADMDISKLLKNNEESENQSISVKR